MDTWTSQSGYPVVTVDVHANRTQLVISQKRFLLHNKNHTDNTRWNIPLNYATTVHNSNFNSTKTSFMLSQRAGATITIDMKPEVDWIVFNVQQTGQ